MSTHGEAVEDIKKAKTVVDSVESPTHGELFSHPDPKKHQYISFVKSAIRIAAGVALTSSGWLEMNPYIMWAGILLVVAEVLGIAEELV